MINYDLLKEALQLLDTEEAEQAIAEIDKLQQLDTDSKMSEAEMKEFLVDNIDRISPSDAYFIQYQQAFKIRHAMMVDANNESPSAATNQAIFTIGNKTLSIGCFNAEAVGAFDDALLEIMQNAVEQIYLR